jgi:hypothetical protein
MNYWNPLTRDAYDRWKLSSPEDGEINETPETLYDEDGAEDPGVPGGA